MEDVNLSSTPDVLSAVQRSVAEARKRPWRAQRCAIDLIS